MCGTAGKAELVHQAVSLAVGLRAGSAISRRRSRPSHSFTVSAGLGAGARLEFLAVLEVEAGLREPFGDLPVGEAEAQMRVLVAQELQRVRREIDDQQPAGRPQQPRRLADRRGGSSR